MTEDCRRGWVGSQLVLGVHKFAMNNNTKYAHSLLGVEVNGMEYTTSAPTLRCPLPSELSERPEPGLRSGGLVPKPNLPAAAAAAAGKSSAAKPGAQPRNQRRALQRAQ